MRLIRDGEKGGGRGKGVWRWGKRAIIYHQNDFCIKVGCDESHFNVSLIVRDKVTRQCPQTITYEEKGEPKRIRTEALQPNVRLTARPKLLTTGQEPSSIVS